MTSNRVLIGAEIDKIVSILTVTAIIAVAIHRARRLLISAVAEGAAAHALSRFFAPEVARQITAAETELRAGEGYAIDATILFTDIRDFTLHAHSVPPAELIASLAEYQALVVGIVQDRNGTIDKFMGDGVMVTFGASRPSDTDAADALGAINALMRAAARWNAARADAGKQVLQVGAAAASGRVICGAVGDETRLEYTVIGDAVNLAAKLEKHTKVERVRALVAAETFDRARSQGYRATDSAEPRPSRSVEGLDHPVDIVVVAA
jgi:adenylate cyclase